MITETLTILPLLFSMPSTWPGGNAAFSTSIFVGDVRFLPFNAGKEGIHETAASVIGQPSAATFLGPSFEIDSLVERDGAYRKLIQEILSYRSVAAGSDIDTPWNTTDAEEKVLAFLSAIPINIPLPKPMLLSEQIALYWDSDGSYAEIDFDGTDYIDAYGKRPGIPEVALDRLRITDAAGGFSFPTQLERIISTAEEG